MNLKKILKRSPFSPVLFYIRYWITRYVIKRRILNVKTFVNSSLLSVSSGVNFFGYYNLSPINERGDILFLKVEKEEVRGSLHEPASIMLKQTDGAIQKIAETNSWNWQQGCMVQWLPLNCKYLIFNDYDEANDRYISKIINSKGVIIKTYNNPIYNVSKCGSYALTLDYSRLAQMRPDYGYFNKKEFILLNEREDGIWRVDLDSGNVFLIISLDELKRLSWSPTMEEAKHKVNHIDINPSGKRFMFLHRWKGSHGRFMRLLTANSNGEEIRIINGDIMTSHSCWLDDNHILSYCNFNGSNGYFKFIDDDNNQAFLMANMPNRDGHPSLSPDGKWIVTDTYPDVSRFSELYLYNIKNAETILLGQFFQPLRYNKEKRIDLHPKWGNDSRSIFFESGHTKQRRLYLFSINIKELS
jgi:hypothetical protein